MSETTGASEEVAAGLRSILDRVGEFFHIFDLSFFVAGASTFAACSFLYLMLEKPHTFPFEAWIGALVIIACYVSGLVAFAVGRQISGWTFAASHSTVASVCAGIAVAAAYFSFRRGAAYFEYQIEDVVAHFAVRRAALASIK